MAVITATVAGFGTVTATGTKPFATVGEGQRYNGALRFVDATGADAHLTINGQKATSVFANRAKTQANVATILAAINA